MTDTRAAPARCLLPLAVALLGIAGSALAECTPKADHHLHIQSALVTGFLGEIRQAKPELFHGIPDDVFRVRSGEDALRELDRAGIGQGVLLSAGYMFGFSATPLAPAEMTKRMRAENRFNVDQALASNGRLLAMVGINPFLANAMEELAFWSKEPGAGGVKLHLGNSGLDLGNPEQVRQLADFVGAANRARMPLVIHLRGTAPFTRENVGTFIAEVLPQAGDLPVQIAHGGSFGGIDGATVEALRLYGEAMAKRVPGTANLVIDLSAVAQFDLSSLEGMPKEGIDTHTAREWREIYVGEMRKIGLDRFLLASDWPAMTPPADYFAAERKALPVTDAEWAILCNNLAPYLREGWKTRQGNRLATDI